MNACIVLRTLPPNAVHTNRVLKYAENMWKKWFQNLSFKLPPYGRHIFSFFVFPFFAQSAPCLRSTSKYHPFLWNFYFGPIFCVFASDHFIMSYKNLLKQCFLTADWQLSRDVVGDESDREMELNMELSAAFSKHCSFFFFFSLQLHVSVCLFTWNDAFAQIICIVQMSITNSSFILL